MALEESQIRQIVRLVFDNAYEVIKANQNGSQPPKPFITYNVRSNRGIGHDEAQDVDETGFRNVSGNRIGSVEINFYGVNAESLAQKLFDSLGLETIIDHASFLGVEILDRMPVIDLTEVQEDQKTARAMVEFSCLWKSLTAEEVQFITDLEISYEVTGTFLLARTFSTGL